MVTGVEKQARPHDELIRELLDSRIPKSEREHAAAREIEAQRAEVERLSRADAFIRFATLIATLIRNEALEGAAGVCIEVGSTKGNCDAAFDMADACAAAIRAMKEQT